jgi:tRNA isopentenyl-2-thiomethyl-A-37 hydroxylase MiaE
VDPNAKYSLQSLLILPIQRIPRYRLLLKDLLATSTTAFSLSRPLSQVVETNDLELELTNLENALDLVDKVASFINEGIRHYERASEILEFQKRMIGCPFPLFAPARKLLHSGNLTKVSRKSEDQRFALLFSDSIVLTR